MLAYFHCTFPILPCTPIILPCSPTMDYDDTSKILEIDEVLLFPLCLTPYFFISNTLFFKRNINVWIY